MLFKPKTSFQYKMEVNVKCYITAEVARVRKWFIKVQQFTDSTLLYWQQYTFRLQTIIYNKPLSNTHHHHHCVVVDVAVVIIIIVVVVTSVIGLFFLVLLLKQRWSPSLKLQVSDCSTVRIMCDDPSIVVFCSESIECFPGMVSKFFLKHFVAIRMAPTITGTILCFRFHIHSISIHKLWYFSFFFVSFCMTFLSAGIATSISMHIFSFLFLIIISGPLVVNSLFVCTAWFHNTVTSSCSYTGLGMCVYHLSVISVPRALHTE